MAGDGSHKGEQRRQVDQAIVEQIRHTISPATGAFSTAAMLDTVVV